MQDVLGVPPAKWREDEEISIFADAVGPERLGGLVQVAPGSEKEATLSPVEAEGGDASSRATLRSPAIDDVGGFAGLGGGRQRGEVVRELDLELVHRTGPAPCPAPAAARDERKGFLMTGLPAPSTPPGGAPAIDRAAPLGYPRPSHPEREDA